MRGFVNRYVYIYTKIYDNVTTWHGSDWVGYTVATFKKQNIILNFL